jgi:mRNA-degrading endonuclease RelE of RelBE toxin-antitoxin system
MFSCLFITCQNIWLESSTTIKIKSGNHYKLIFLIDVAFLGIKFLDFGNSTLNYTYSNNY